MTTDLPVRIRRGLPRTPGGPAWPDVPGAIHASPVASSPSAGVAPPVAAPSLGSPVSDPAPGVQGPVRRGLPRTPGGEPWPPRGAAAVTPITAVPPAGAEAVAPAAEAVPPAAGRAPVSVEPAATPSAPAAPELAPGSSPATLGEQPAIDRYSLSPATTPAVTQPTPPPDTAAAPVSATRGWTRRAVYWVLGAIGAAGVIVLAARGVTTLPGVPAFMERFPGEYAPRVPVDPGFPAWARWAHYLNFFFMVLIVRTGLLVRTQQRPDAYFTPRRGGGKMSLYLWLHTSIDVLWLTNGIIFVVLLFASGHWARIVPTSWEVFPNALSAGLQYLTLEWPHEDGWVNYNSLQQLMYFTVVFIAAPLAAITGVRMSEWWPTRAPRLNALYPSPIARAIHFPVMLFFVLFVIVHVFLVFTTGALKNLNHMFAGTPEISWVGFGLFALGLLLAAAVTWAARPIVIAPIATLFGRVSER